MAIRRDGRLQPPPEITDTPPTRPLRRAETAGAETLLPGEPQAPSARPGERTRLFQGGSLPGQEGEGALSDPLVGWLVIIEGPGRGRVLTLGYGVNSVGRGAKARVRLEFGDREISRNAHALITYDPRGRRFYLQHGGGINLTYLNEQPVLAAIELRGGEVIAVGRTRLRFVPFCGAEFDWQMPGQG